MADVLRDVVATGISDDGSQLVVGATTSEVDSDSGDGMSTSESDSQSHQSSSTKRSRKTNEIGKEETHMVRRSKMVVFAVLFLATILCGGGAYLFGTNSEKQTFHTQFEDYAVEIIELSQLRGRQITETFNSMSITTTSYALDKGLTWPYVTLPHFERRGSQVLELSGATYVGLSPLITEEQREDWERWSVQHQDWIPEHYNTSSVSGTISYFNRTTGQLGGPQEELVGPYFAPLWQVAPIIPSLVNMDLFTYDPNGATLLNGVFDEIQRTRRTSFSMMSTFGDNFDPTNEWTWPFLYVAYPIFDNFDDDVEENSNLVALFSSTMPWHKFFVNLLPHAAKGLYVVVKNTCSQVVSYRIDGPDIYFLGEGDSHEEKYTDMEIAAPYNITLEDDCSYTLHIYPSEDLHATFRTHKPVVYTTAVVLIFVMTSFVFVIYDKLVQRRQKTVLTSAQRSDAIVSSLFPQQVRDRLMEEGEANRRTSSTKGEAAATTTILRNAFSSTTTPAMTSPLSSSSSPSDKPIADLFPSASVMFADICGFTAWSSVREPTQVFTLLEKIYGSFDAIAKRRRVFKVETIGDCYVAATGLPEQRPDHAELIAKFANECRYTVNKVVKQLEVTLGPDTGDLAMRFGLHSGPVTAGVLRGEKSRFQLFGDTVNTASRIESSGERDRIHVSADTAKLLVDAGKSEWVHPREGMITAKGKGSMQTFWLTIKKNKTCADNETNEEEEYDDQNTSAEDKVLQSVQEQDTLDTKSVSSSGSSYADDSNRNLMTKVQRLVDWNVEVLQQNLKKIIAMREDPNTTGEVMNMNRPSQGTIPEREDLTIDRIGNLDGRTVLDEVQEVISFSTDAKEYKQDPEQVVLGDIVKKQLEDYVASIAAMYQDNPFHSFEHASHVTMSVTKLLSRVVTPDSIDYKDLCYKKQPEEAQLHTYTYGITSDPLIQFACTLSALIHDVDHPGVPNITLVREQTDLATVYKNKSVAEQNSVDLAWELLMEPSYKELRETIYTNEEEMNRFRQLVVNAVMATDIVDQELKNLRNGRWDKAFSLSSENNGGANSQSELDQQQQEDLNRKATIVIEHLIQASDVAHTMQHWHVYVKWNERLFHEMYKAYQASRSGDKDPSDFWYNGELGFFDHYIIPLAKKLKECGVFGVSSEEYLNYALANRKEWEAKGKEMTKSYLAKYHEK